MKTKHAIKLAGSRTKLAAILGLTRQAVCQWGVNVPELNVYRLKELRPEWFAEKVKS